MFYTKTDYWLLGYFKFIFVRSGGIGVGAGSGGAGGVFNVGFGNFGGVGANVGLANPLSSDPGYVQYMNQHYKPPIQYYYTDSQPIQVYPVSPEPIRTSPPRFQHQARTPPRGVLIPVYYWENHILGCFIITRNYQNIHSQHKNIDKRSTNLYIWYFMQTLMSI